MNGELVGVLGVYQFNQHEVEISGMVHPSSRRQGIFSALVRAAMSEIKRRGISKLIFINAQTSVSGREFLLRLGAEYSFSEYWMQLVRDTIPATSYAVRLRPYELTDRDFVARSLSEGFEMTIDDTLASLNGDGGSDSDRARYVIERDGDVIGTLSVQRSDALHAFIFGFAVLREQRGRGYGRQALMQVIQQAKGEHRTTVELEVAAANDSALSLYRSCGFEALRANDYYVLYA